MEDEESSQESWTLERTFFPMLSSAMGISCFSLAPKKGTYNAAAPAAKRGRSCCFMITKSLTFKTEDLRRRSEVSMKETSIELKRVNLFPPRDLLW